MALSRIAPYAQTGDSLEKPGWWGRRFRLPTAQARIKSWQEKAPAPPFFIKFRGAEAPSQQGLPRGRRSPVRRVPKTVRLPAAGADCISPTALQSYPSVRAIQIGGAAHTTPVALTCRNGGLAANHRSEEHTSELQSLRHLVCRLLLEKKKT